MENLFFFCKEFLNFQLFAVFMEDRDANVIALSIGIILWLYFIKLQQKDLKNLSSDRVFHGD